MDSDDRLAHMMSSKYQDCTVSRQPMNGAPLCKSPHVEPPASLRLMGGSAPLARSARISRRTKV